MATLVIFVGGLLGLNLLAGILAARNDRTEAQPAEVEA